MSKKDTTLVSEHDMHKTSTLGSSGWLTPEEVSRVLPNTSAKSVRAWCAAGHLPGAIQLPSRRWQIPWSTVIGILGFDPRTPPQTAPATEDADDPPPDVPLPGLGV